jgi:hypothetical protein
MATCINKFENNNLTLQMIFFGFTMGISGLNAS